MNNRTRPESATETLVSTTGEAFRGGRRSGACTCCIIPQRVLERFAKDKKLTTEQRQYFVNAAKLERDWRSARVATARLAKRSQAILPTAVNALAAAGPPAILLFDCGHGTTLPGTPIANPGASTDASAKRTFKETTAVVNFYQTLFGRNSLDNAGLTLLSSIHFSVNYNNAGWTGSQMRYGDGDGNIFIDFTKSNDVIGHELTHGVTQFTAGFAYRNQSGGLNESMSDVFGSMFRQWEANQTVSAADWLIGKDIMGPAQSLAGSSVCETCRTRPRTTAWRRSRPNSRNTKTAWTLMTAVAFRTSRSTRLRRPSVGKAGKRRARSGIKH